jgi:hypothetical protein
MNQFRFVRHLFAAYLHQDWDLEYSSAMEAIRQFWTDTPSEVRIQVLADLAGLLGLSDAKLEAYLYEDVCLGYWPPGDQMTEREWLLGLQEHFKENV